MMLIEIYWDGEEAKVKYTQDFLTADRIVQLDALVDARVALIETYESLLQEKNT